MQRVLVIGSPGAGKSTFARRLGEKTGLPVIHLDQLFWTPGWVSAPTELYRQRVSDVVAGERWIIDGNYSSTFDLRLPHAAAVILLERSRAACLWRVIKRIVSSYGRVRVDMAEGCPEHFSFEFMRFVWNFPIAHRQRGRDAITRHEAWSRTTVLKSDREAEAFLSRATSAGA